MSMVMAIMLTACNENDGYKEKYEKLLSETEANGTSTEESIAEPSNTESIREESNKLIESKVEESTKTTNDNSTYVIHSSSENDKYETKSKFADVFIENLNKYKKIINEYSDKTQDLKSRLGNNFNIYVNNESYLKEWYNNFENDYSSLFKETESITQAIFEKIKSEIPAQNYYEWTDEMDYIYDDYYDGAFDDIYEEFYNGILDEIYESYYEEVLDNKPDDVEYSDWSKIRSNFYKSWSNARSDFYKAWSNLRSSFYKSWSKTKSEMYKIYSRK